MKEQDTIEINVIQLLKALWAKKLLILLVAIVTGAAAFAYSSLWSNLSIEVQRESMWSIEIKVTNQV